MAKATAPNTPILQRQQNKGLLKAHNRTDTLGVNIFKDQKSSSLQILDPPSQFNQKPLSLQPLTYLIYPCLFSAAFTSNKKKHAIYCK